MQQQRDAGTELSQMISQMHMLNVEITHYVCVYLVGYVIIQHVTSYFFFCYLSKCQSTTMRKPSPRMLLDF